MIRSLLVLSFLFILFVPETVNAQSGFVTCSGLDCSACNLAEMGNLIIIWLMGVLFVVFAVLMAIAGWGLVTSGGNTGAKQTAKDKFTNAVIGLIIVLAAWLLVDTLMRALLSTVGGTGPLPQGYIDGYGPWAQVQCQSQEATEVLGIYRAGSSAVDPVAGDITAPTGGPTTGLSQADAEAALAAGSFTVVSSGNCSDPANSTCTSLVGLQPVAATRAVELQAAVGAPLVITGATETGHAAGTYSHSNGYKIDFRTTPELNNHITTNFTNIGGSRWRDPNGNVYYRHGAATNSDHWDVTFTN